MAAVPQIPPPVRDIDEVVVTEEVIDYESVPPTGVRRRLDALEERDVQRVRWGAVLSGLFFAVATQMLLALLGAAVGLTAINPRSPNLLDGFGLGAGLWMGLAALLSLFIGGYAAAKLSGAIRRSDGVVSGLLTWASMLVLTLWLVGSGIGTAMSAASGAMQNPDLTRRGQPAGAVHRPGDMLRDAGVTARENVDTAARGAWYSFGGAVLSLLVAGTGGAVGASGRVRRDRGPGMPMRREMRTVG